MPFIYLQTSDYIKFSVDLKIAKCFGTIKNLLGCCGDSNVEEDIIHLEIVQADILQRVLHWAHHKLNYGNSETWIAQFLDVDRQTLYKFLMAAKYLDEPDLSHAVASKIASCRPGLMPAKRMQKFYNFDEKATDFTAKSYQEP